MITVQVRQNLFGYAYEASRTRFLHYTGLLSGRVIVAEKAKPLTCREQHSVTVFDSCKILVIGGYIHSEKQVVGSAELYEIRLNRWRKLGRHDLQIARKCHSGCQMGDSIFVFGGMSRDGKVLNSIERLRCLGSETKSWQLLQFDLPSFKGRLFA